MPVAGPQTRGDHALRLDGDDAGHPRQRVPGGERTRLHEGHRHILPLGHGELRHDQRVDRVDEDEADDEDGRGEADADNRRRGPERMARDVPDNHAARVAQPAADPPPLEAAAAVVAWRLGTHGFGRRDTHRPSNGGERAERGGPERQRRRLEHDRRTER